MASMETKNTYRVKYEYNEKGKNENSPLKDWKMLNVNSILDSDLDAILFAWHVTFSFYQTKALNNSSFFKPYLQHRPSSFSV